MAISLNKGQRVSLDKGLSMVRIGLGWDTNKYTGNADFDLDASVFLLGANGKVTKDEDFVFYNNLSAYDNAVKHTGDNRTGGDDGDDEQIIVDLSRVPSHIEKIVVTVTIFEAEKRAQNFGQVSNAYVRLCRIESDTDEGSEELRFCLTEEFSIETAIVACEIYRYNGEWKFNAVGAGYQNGLAALCATYGIDAE